ncbi:hypothetical protein [Embleya hyalina]|uniref:Lipoprotein n=1 Tax=Embleya hyalina TaxID=516124 RepID=A0A401YXN3_9ACTN|nr:hypothetical protein [Embleya hyalina]GCD99310.1 hypothetical protein EHYA_07024 [Embleya hyalina]
MSSFVHSSWSKTAVSPVMVGLTGAFVVASAVVSAMYGFIGSGIGLLGGAVLCAFLSVVRVHVDQRGLTVEFGLLPWPRKRVPLGEIRTAGHREVRALREFGGWGYRIKSSATGVVQRSGEALTLTLVSGREFVVTVSDAPQGAAVLNRLLGNRV